ncbi:MAG TPA: hypothetical protein VHV82_16950 [Sporichthyaceae bacterium]|nr:hypothetical protein [Sporichthyaceae bacterium]
MKAENDATTAILETPEATATKWQMLTAGAKDDAYSINTAKQLADDHPGDPAVRNAARNLHRLTLAGRGNFATGVALDAAGKAQEWGDSYRCFKDQFKLARGWV